MKTKNLKELAIYLNSTNKKDIDFSSLPVFSDNRPIDTFEVYSFDDKNIITEVHGKFVIENRCVCGEAEFNCMCP